jgi:hypothetical protein
MEHPHSDPPTLGKFHHGTWAHSMDPPALHPGMPPGGTESLHPRRGSRQGAPTPSFGRRSLRSREAEPPSRWSPSLDTFLSRIGRMLKSESGLWGASGALLEMDLYLPELMLGHRGCGLS